MKQIVKAIIAPTYGNNNDNSTSNSVSGGGSQQFISACNSNHPQCSAKWDPKHAYMPIRKKKKSGGPRLPPSPFRDCRQQDVSKAMLNLLVSDGAI